MTDIIEVVRCQNCKHSIEMESYHTKKYLCVLKSTVKHLEEHEANYFCADGDNKNKKGNEI